MTFDIEVLLKKELKQSCYGQIQNLACRTSKIGFFIGESLSLKAILDNDFTSKAQATIDWFQQWKLFETQFELQSGNVLLSGARIHTNNTEKKSKAISCCSP